MLGELTQAGDIMEAGMRRVKEDILPMISDIDGKYLK